MSSKHTLFIDTLPGQVYTYYLTELTEEGVDTHEDFNKLRNANEYDYLQIRIDSDGGLIRTGQALINIIDDIFKGRTVTVIEANAGSMAAIIFCKGDERIVYRHSLIMFHNYTGGYYGKGNEIKAWFPAFDAMFKEYLITHTTGLSKKELDKIFRGEDFWFNADQMLERGIATHIIIDGVKYTAAEYLKEIKHASKSTSPGSQVLPDQGV